MMLGVKKKLSLSLVIALLTKRLSNMHAGRGLVLRYLLAFELFCIVYKTHLHTSYKHGMRDSENRPLFGTCAALVNPDGIFLVRKELPPISNQSRR